MRITELKTMLFNNALLRITFIAGVMLFVLTGFFLTGFYLLERNVSKTTRMQDSFSRILREYDISAEVFVGTEKEFENLNRELDRLEKRAIGVESWLSVIKRRRALAGRYPPSAGNYRASINRALKAYPSSQPLIAVAASALVKDTAINNETQNALRGFLHMLTDSDFNKLRLSVHVLLGDFKNPSNAANLPDDILSDGTEIITQNLIIMKILNLDSGADTDIQTILNSSFPSGNFIRFAAEYNYDFGDLRRAALLFSRLEGDAAIRRQADSLYLAGFPKSARSLWLILSAIPDERSLYNLAVTTDNEQEASEYLKKIIDMDTMSVSDSRQFGLIRYSRLLPGTQAVALLEKTEKLNPSAFPFIDLELCKRKTEGQPPARKLAETWLLLERLENEDLYRWAAWLMAFQRDYDELNILLKRLVSERRQSPEWISFYRAIQLMREGEIDSAFDILESIPQESAEWYVYANLGRILETQRSLSRAVEQYNLAAEKVPDNKTASRIQYNLSKCYSVMGRAVESRLALEDALYF
ncbi:MAG: hypothetical protein LBI04_12455, partial [Treponema sp.]|nr:hypothetical protein [Treponema sp.]